MSYQSRQASAGNQEQLKNNNFMTAESGAVKGVSSHDSLGVGGTVIEEEATNKIGFSTSTENLYRARQRYY